MAEVAPGRFVAPSTLPIAGTFDPNDYLLGLTGSPLNSRRIRLESLLAFLEARIAEVAVAQAVGQAIALLSGSPDMYLQIALADADEELKVSDFVVQLLRAGSVFTLPALPAKCFCLYANATGASVTLAGLTLPADSIGILVKAEGMSQGKFTSFSTNVWTNV